MKIQFNLNEKDITVETQADTSLMEVLRDLGCNSVKYGCGSGICGSCTVLLNNKPVSSCKIPVALVHTSSIVTLESFSKTEEYQFIIKGFEKAGIKLCGYCNSGKIFTAYSLLQYKTIPKTDEIEKKFKNLSPCCTDTNSLVAGLKYALAYKQKKQG